VSRAVTPLTLAERLAHSDALLSELASLWGAQGDVIAHLDRVPASVRGAGVAPDPRTGVALVECRPWGLEQPGRTLILNVEREHA
jgi:hypothetical protein